MMDKYDNLDKLVKLKEQGTITEAEFEIEKQKILSSEQTTTAQSINMDTPATQTKKANGYGIVGFVLSIIGGFSWYFTLPVAGVALIFSLVGVMRSKQEYKMGLSIAGLVLSLLLILIWIVWYDIIVPHYDKPTGWF